MSTYQMFLIDVIERVSCTRVSARPRRPTPAPNPRSTPGRQRAEYADMLWLRTSAFGKLCACIYTYSIVFSIHFDTFQSVTLPYLPRYSLAARCCFEVAVQPAAHQVSAQIFCFWKWRRSRKGLGEGLGDRVGRWLGDCLAARCPFSAFLDDLFGVVGKLPRPTLLAQPPSPNPCCPAPFAQTPSPNLCRPLRPTPLAPRRPSASGSGNRSHFLRQWIYETYTGIYRTYI